MSNPTDLKFLIVDDFSTMRRIVRGLLKEIGYANADEAEDGAVALKMLQNAKYDFIVSDINMPVMDGLTLLTKLPAANPVVKAVMVSAYGDMENIRTAMNRGAFDFVCKPVDFADLELTIDKAALHVAQLRQTIRAIQENNILRMFVDESVLNVMARPGFINTLQASEIVTATVVFIDICGFTALAEVLLPPEVVTLLNTYFDQAVKEIIAQGGYVDKFIGDAIMATAMVGHDGHRGWVYYVEPSHREPTALFVPEPEGMVIKCSKCHVEPALALADALRRIEPSCEVTALGTATGLEARLVPARGYALAEIPRVPLPRRPTLDLLRLPGRLAGAVRVTRRHLDRVGADVVVGFGGYVALPAYLAGRRRGTPLVVHEANARAGLANRIGARLTPYIATAVAGTGLRRAQVLGIPLREQIATLDRAATRERGRAHFGLAAGPVLLVTGGSQGARRLNQAVAAAAPALAAAGVQVLHVAGDAQAAAVREQVGGLAGHHVLGYCDRMDLAYAAADLAVCRAGAMTCAELAAVGLPAVYVPLPIGNGEQALNAGPTVSAGGGLLVADAELDGGWLVAQAVPLLRDPVRLAAMGRAAERLGHRDADVALARLVLRAADRVSV